MGKSIFKPIYEDLLNQIKTGKLLPGMPLPSEKTLTYQYGASRPTIRRAMGLLVEQGLVIRHPGIGSVIASPSQAVKEKPLKIGIDWNPAEAYDPTSFYSDKLLEGILSIAVPHGHTIKFLPRSLHHLQAVQELDGIILTDLTPTAESESHYVKLARQGIPVVLLNRFPAARELSYISVDYYRETYRVINRMIQNGARRIMLYGPNGYKMPQFSGRIAAWQDAHRAHGLTIDPALTIKDSLPDTLEGLQHLLKHNPPEVIFILHGNNTLSLMPLIASLNLRIPEDLSLFCFDDIGALGEAMKIPFSFIKMPLLKMGEQAVTHIEACHAAPTAPLQLTVNASVEVNECNYLI